MVILRKSPADGRLIRMDEDIRELGENTIGKLKEAIQHGDQELALALADYLLIEGKDIHDRYSDWAFVGLDWVARNYGEEEIPKLLRAVGDNYSKASKLISGRYSTTVRDRVIILAEAMRAHRSGRKETGDFKVWEEADRYVMEFDPCGSGGRMVRGPANGTGSRVKPPHNLGKTTKQYPWSWGKAGVPYYCTHCCVWHEIMGIETVGYPWRVTECPVDDFEKPCHWYLYKDPGLIPEAYFERVGFKKDPSKFKR